MTTIQGPAAPKDPTRKRPFFYIMQEKEIFGAKRQMAEAFSLFMRMITGSSTVHR